MYSTDMVFAGPPKKRWRSYVDMESEENSAKMSPSETDDLDDSEEPLFDKNVGPFSPERANDPSSEDELDMVNDVEKTSPAVGFENLPQDIMKDYIKYLESLNFRTDLLGIKPLCPELSIQKKSSAKKRKISDKKVTSNRRVKRSCKKTPPKKKISKFNKRIKKQATRRSPRFQRRKSGTAVATRSSEDESEEEITNVQEETSHKTHKCLSDKQTTTRRIMCPLCPKSYPNRKTFLDHLNSHMDLRPYKCKECGKGFSRQPSLKDHVRLHSNIRNFECSICQKAFVSASVLNKHMRVHSTDKNYECDQCGLRFKLVQTLISHKKTHIVSDEVFFCDVCDTKFTKKKSLTDHKRLKHYLKDSNHPAGELVYACDMCDAKYSIRKSFVDHKRMKHSNKATNNGKVTRKPMDIGNDLRPSSGTESQHRCYGTNESLFIDVDNINETEDPLIINGQPLDLEKSILFNCKEGSDSDEDYEDDEGLRAQSEMPSKRKQLFDLDKKVLRDITSNCESESDCTDDFTIDECDTQNVKYSITSKPDYAVVYSEESEVDVGTEEFP